MTLVETAIVAAKTVTLLLGSLVTYLAYRAYRRTGSASLRALALGFGVITGGAIVAGGLDQFTSFGLLYGVLVQSTLTALGFAIITYSLRME